MHIQDQDNPNFSFIDEVINITGRALPEFAAMAWTPFINELREYIKSKRYLTINFKLDYFNSASSRFITDMFSILNSTRTCKTTVNWYYFDGDDTTEENGEIYKERNLKVKVNIIKRND